MTRIHFDVSRWGHWHRREAERILEEAADGARVAQVVTDRGSADFTVTVVAHSLLNGTLPPATPLPERTFAWSEDDQPSGFESGLYCSLTSPLFDPRRHRSFCYLVRYNEQIAPYDLGEARRLFSFVGAMSSGLRSRLLRMYASPSSEWECRLSRGPWEAMFDRSGLDVKRSYAESFRRAKFILCPRGNGAASIRLFETMEARRVPVIISDAYVLPSGIDWGACAVLVRENQLAELPRLLREKEPLWPQMAEAARAAWETNFSPRVLADSVLARIRELPSPPPSPASARILYELCRFRARRLATLTHGAVSRWRQRLLAR